MPLACDGTSTATTKLGIAGVSHACVARSGSTRRSVKLIDAEDTDVTRPPPRFYAGKDNAAVPRALGVGV